MASLLHLAFEVVGNRDILVGVVCAGFETAARVAGNTQAIEAGKDCADPYAVDADKFVALSTLQEGDFVFTDRDPTLDLLQRYSSFVHVRKSLGL